MAKKQSFADKSSKKEAIQFVKYVKSIKTEAGAWKFRTMNVGVCKCNHAEVYG